MSRSDHALGSATPLTSSTRQRPFWRSSENVMTFSRADWRTQSPGSIVATTVARFAARA